MKTNTDKSNLRNLSALVDFSTIINSSLETSFILNNLLLTSFGKFHATKGLVLLVNDGMLMYATAKGLTHSAIDNLPKILDKDYKLSEEFNVYLSEQKLLHSQEIYSTDKFIGVLFLGERLTGLEYSDEDSKFLQTFLNITATALDNSLSINKLKKVNNNLDNKVHQLSALFDLSKEFSGILEIPLISKLLGFSIIGQLLVSKYAVVLFKEDEFNILESKFNSELLNENINVLNVEEIVNPIYCYGDEGKSCSPLFDMGIELIVPMKIKNKLKGLILLGERNTGEKYSKSDIEFVSSLGGLAIISIENSLLFKEAIEKQKMEKDLEIAKKIQRNLLPSKLPKMKQFEIVAYNRAARQVGGDYYDVIKLDDDRMLFAIADVSGKGVQAALLMANLQAFLKAISKQEKTLVEASNFLNDLVSENTSDGRFITFFWGILDESNISLESVNMGHNPPLLIRNGAISKLKLGGMLMGVMEKLKF
jgi:sigma-B regulation protein RsbU (phosphoserine phosphatase)